MAISAASSLVLVPPGRGQAMTRPDGEPVGTSADELNRQLKDQRERSVAWQLIRQTVGEDASASDDPAAVTTDAAPPPPPTTPAQSVAAAPGVDVEAIRVELHVADVSVDDRGVRVTQLDLTYERLAVRKAPEPPVQKSDPLALDLDGDGRITTTGVDGGRVFDLNADGRRDRASVVAGGDAFLALDANGNGRIDDGRELFGDQTGAANGFEALRGHDDNGDGRIDAADAIYQRLRLLDWNADGSQRLRTLADAGVAAISLNYADTNQPLNAIDRVAQQGSFTRSDGSQGLAADLLLGFRALA
ncbi:hypothetical protein AAG565_02375 [Fontimonas sp. SYSU GA230001]|uniref:hypothetical protein n=1 Tax=Fontimonas sp. SYSU GA230001 TaxID=3142450 RepID=UPI0032B3F4F5